MNSLYDFLYFQEPYSECARYPDYNYAMGPSPVEQNPWERYDSDNDDGNRDSDDGWRVGYEVEMRGIGVEEYAYGGDDISETKSNSCDESDGDLYAGYRILPTLDDSFEVASTDHERTSAVVQKDVEEVVSSENANFGLEFDVAKSIELTEDKIEHIKKAMSTFTLPAPSWAKGIDSDNELKKLLQKLKSK
ncbi:hypothetical protein LOAG_00061 [Loa loa]|uniref:Ovule protein n=1 Tax=Loa loa TaxID=7209 RepID=A0A1I7VRK4_LOALO|nr:hypothetical protein LOAG_00061 [Loa loa]EFO28415.1 hypothetical protein LOAG_00061 [Loa loa]